MAYLKGGEILIDISYLPIESYEDQTISLDLLRERERNQIKSLFDDGGYVIESKFKPIILKINYDAGFTYYVVINNITDDKSYMVGLFNTETGQAVKIILFLENMEIQEITQE